MSEATKNADTKPKFKADLEETAAPLMSALTIDSDTGVVSLAADALEKLLPEGQTLESHMAHQKTMDLLGNGLQLALVRKGTEVLKANKKLEQLSMSVPSFGDNKFEAVLRRHGEVRAPGSTEVKKVSGVISLFKHDVVGTRTKAETTHIKNEFRSLAESAGL